MCDCFCPEHPDRTPLDVISCISPVNLKILLLGTGDSGKTTFFRQLRLRYLTGFPSTDIARNANVLRSLTLSTMQKLLEANSLDNGHDTKSAQLERMVMNATELTPKVAVAIETLWELDAVKKTFKDRQEYDLALPSNTEYYFKNASRFAEDLYRPTNQDHCMVKLMTTGVNELSWIDSRDNSITVVDVGGTLPARRKWPQLADSELTCIIYFVSLADNGLPLEEDKTRNRLEDSLESFENVCSSQSFGDKDWALVFNKQDLVYDRASDELEKMCDGMVELMRTSESEESREHWEMREVLNEKNAYKSLMNAYTKRFKGRCQPLAIRNSSINREGTYKVFDMILERFIASQIKQKDRI